MHLSLIEDGAYRRLLDAYYSRELPIPKESSVIYRLVRADSKAERTAVNSVLKGFFKLSRDGWHHERCDQELARYHEKRQKAQGSANARWEAVRRNANALRTQCDGNALQSPITNNQSLKNSEGQNGLSRKEQLMNAVRKTAQGMKTKESP